MTHTSFVGSSEADRERLLREIGAASMDELFADVPAALQTSDFAVPPGRSELEMIEEMRARAGRNATHLVNFCGAGFYDHFIPAAVDALAARGEFLTAYTPYQPEASQGTLQAIYEYQTAIARITGMEVSNASLYDGGTALFEAVHMAAARTRRRRVLVCEGVNPIYRAMLDCHTRRLPLEIIYIPLVEGATDRAAFAAGLDGRTAAVVLALPGFPGTVEDHGVTIEAAHRAGALGIVSAYPVALGLVRPPGAMGADIVTGDGQSLGMPLAFGGPYLGFMATRKDLARRMPGRVVGATHDARGRRGFVLTLQAREQHIRREKATSNICTNQSLCALRALIFLALLGRKGFAELAETCAARAAYACERLCAIPGVRRAFPHPFFNEFTLELPADASDVVSRLIDRGLAAGFPLGRYYRNAERHLLVAVTEKRTKEEIDILAARLETALRDGSGPPPRSPEPGEHAP